MKLIEPGVEKVVQGDDPFIHIERLGRICYKSEKEDYTHESGVKFFNSLVNSGHFSVLEHANFVFLFKSEGMFESVKSEVMFGRVCKNKYLNCTRCVDISTGEDRMIVSGNLRAIAESKTCLGTILANAYPEMKDYLGEDEDRSYRPEDWCCLAPVDYKFTEREKPYHTYHSFVFTTDRGVSHEMVRHRPASFSQESTRYCNYSNKKFGGELTFIKPADFDSWNHTSQVHYNHGLRVAEKIYFGMLADGRTPQEARGVLPTDLKTTIAMTANEQEWSHFFNLRYFETTGKAHPNMKKIAEMAYKLYTE